MIHADKSKKIQISIIIPAYNEEKNIARCLNAIFNQKKHNIEFEVRIIDDASDDNTRGVVEEYIRSSGRNNIFVTSNKENLGRFKTRMSGIKSAKFDLIFLLDSKVEILSNALQQVEKTNKFPLLATNHKVVEKNPIDRVYNLIRYKAYHGNYPKARQDNEEITTKKFNQYPKGTTAFICQKDLLLSSIPEYIGKNSSDDTKWLYNITIKEPITISNQFEFNYYSRDSIAEILKHLYERGPKFIDYYYNPGSIYFWIINSAILLALTLSYLVISHALIIHSIVTIELLNIATTIYLSKSRRDILTLQLLIPLLVTIFALGALKGISIKILKMKIKK